ncbi:iron complex outermembrane receptor protein [Pseudoduganella flava]|uniref:Iron complex outermembrane receptor protein n=1 Tax=Pseudoduganella flava TaxID=871742 RepID=A0A562PWS0_9BURK|nr:TonB-dependent receptor [Pseudoduganella flava]QGZ39938.1 TonB-dependent receptor [Pseudoduganella flava]TWI48874.1 iron complex outermembrane receptor protein [Pseudoduganella flava]
MHKQARKAPLALAVAIALPALAQAQEQGLEQVVVTANKRVEKLEHVPMAISVLTDTVIQNNNVRDIEDVIALSPALTITYGTTPQNNGINMRGVGTTSIGIGVEADVSVILDDIPMGMQVKAFQDLADLQRVEILKGPQSTLFGKAAIAGAVNITTKPISGPLRANTSALYTNDGEWRLRASYGGMLTERFGLRISGSTARFGGLLHNITNDTDANGSSDKSLMAKFIWHATDDVDVEFSPRINRSVRNCCAIALTGITPATGGLLSNIPQLPATELLAGIPIGPDNTTIRNNDRTGQDSVDRGAGLKVSWAMPNGATLSSISAVSHYTADDSRDQDFVDANTLLYYPYANGQPAGVAAGYVQYGTTVVDSRSQELRLVSPDSGALRYVAGLWYAKNAIARHFVRGFNGIALTTPVQYDTATYNRTYAAFGQATWDFAPTWSVLAGLRYNHETSGYRYAKGAPPPGEFVVTEAYSSLGNSEGAVTGKLSLQKQFTPGVMGYVMAATGYKGMAYDLTSSLNAATAAQQPVKSETARTFEAGMKGNFLNNRLTVSLAAFHTKFDDYQQNSGSYLPGTTTYVTRLNSVGGVETKGIELDTSALLHRDFVVNASLAYTRASITDFRNAPCYTVAGSPNGGYNAACILKNPEFGGQNTQDVSGGTMPNAPKIKVNVGGQYDLRLAPVSFDGFFTFNTRYTSEVLTNLNQDPGSRVPGYAITNIGFGVRDKQDRYKLSFFVNNLFDHRYANSGLGGGGSWSSRAPNPVVVVNTTSWNPARDAFRYYGARLDMKF